MKPMDRSYYAEMNTRELETRIKVLRSLCDQLDPYSPLEAETKNRLKELNINPINDPFALTNQLLLLMEDALEELESRHPSRPIN